MKNPIVRRGSHLLLSLTLAASISGHNARAEETDSSSASGPYVTPSVDVSVHYEMVSPQSPLPVHQDMHWQVASLRQRIDPENSAVYMVTSWSDHTLTVVDTLGHRRSVMPAPGATLTLPGQIPPGSFRKLGTDMVSGQLCTVWRTTDQDGHESDACYTQDGILLQVKQQGRILVRALSVDRTPQPDALFAIPESYSAVAPAR